MDYKELIKLSKKAAAKWEGTHKYYQAATLITSLCFAIETLLAEREAAWISAGEKLPKKDDVVLAASADTADMGIAQYCGNGIFLDYGDVWEEVTHWMPLPEPPGGLSQ